VRLVDRGEPGTQKRQGRYVLGDLLGRGGMAEVFAGHAIGSHGFQKPVAIKRLLPELANDHVFVERLIGEAKLLVGMQHGNIVSVLDLARDGEDVFLVMEFMDGPSLRQLLKARGARGLPLAITAYIVQSAAAGLEFAHGRHVIHADISPSNLLLTTSGEVRVADFGIARREGNGAGVVEGKWAYMAPEQARGEPLTARSDVFALGVVLYELVCGQHPLGRQATADERESGPMRVVPPRVVKPSVPAGIDAICMKALAHDPRDRYASMKQLIDALVEERFSNGWREGASELATLIRECIAVDPPAPISSERRTQHTDRPVTIVTRSLISQSKPAAVPPDTAAWAAPIPRASSPKIAAEPDSLDQTSEKLPADVDSIERTGGRRSAPKLATPLAAVLPMVPGLESGARTGLMWVAAPAQVSGDELASVHGGATVTGSAQVALAERSTRWTFGILGVAALLGVSAAIAIQLAPEKLAHTAEAAPVAVAQQAPAPTTVLVPVPVAVETPPPASVETKPAAVEANPAAVETKPGAVETNPARVETTPPAPVETAHAKSETKPALTYHARVTKPAPAAPKKLDATLRVKSDGAWAEVSIGKDLQPLPGAKFHLAAGKYVVHVRNTEMGVSFPCAVSLESNRVVTLTVSVEEQQCFDE
jgi:serine/threonine protein kinase